MKDAFMELTGIEENCWQQLQTGAGPGDHPFRTAVFGTTSANKVYMRTIVVRKVSPLQKQVAFYTDTRSAKWLQLQQQRMGSLLLYDPNDQVQIRLSGSASLHQGDELADEAWSQTGLHQRSNYLSDLAPATILPVVIGNANTTGKQQKLPLAETEQGRKNFGVVVISAGWMEWLWLNRDGHRRAEFHYPGDGSFTGNWLVP